MLVAFKFTHAGTCLRALLLAVVCTFLPAFAAHACGEDTDCKLGDRTYRIAVPADGEPPKGAIIFAHGYRGTAAGVMRNRSMKRAVTGLGLALVAPKSARQDWDIPNAPRPGKFLEKAYFRDLKAALVERHGIDGDRIMMSGFSAGGMMVWNTACHMGDLFAAYVPIAGTFWYPVPDQCTTLPVSIIHIHGTSDR
ncbi:MAG: prolyl oligopeptidase family serine peptidase, partial [Pseudomonadota bacterium]